MRGDVETPEPSQADVEALRERIAELERAEAEHARTQEALRESEERFELAVRGTSDGLWDWNVVTGQTWWSPHCWDLLGYDRGDLPETVDAWSSLVHPDDLDRTMEAIRLHFEEGKAFDVDYRMKTKHDGYHWFTSRAVAVRDDKGAAVRMAGSIRDITESKETEERLRFLSLITEQISDSVITTNLDYEITYANRSFQRVYGYSALELLGRSPGLMNAEPDADRIQAEIYQAVSTGKTWNGVLRNRRKDESIFLCDLTVFPLADEHGRTFAYAGIQRDVTERRQAEDRLRTADRLAAIGTMVAGVAHEINSPLTAISGRAELLAKDGSVRRAARSHAAEIVQQVTRCNKIVQDLLVFSRTGHVSFQNVQVNKLLKRCLGYCANTHRFDGVEIVEEFEPQLPETSGDPMRLEQVFINIIRNAGDALRDVGPLKRLAIRSRSVDGMIQVEFADTGPGIPDPDRIFDAFYTTKRTGEGTGLGLSVSLGIIRDHDGTLSAENTDEGARFIVSLPIRSK